MTTIWEAETLRRSFPSGQLTVSRISRTLFFRVSMNVFAWVCIIPPSGPASRAAEAPPPGMEAAPWPPRSMPASAPAPPPARPCVPWPCVPPPTRLRSCAGSSCTSGFRISALQAYSGAASSAKSPCFSSLKSEKPFFCSSSSTSSILPRKSSAAWVARRP